MRVLGIDQASGRDGWAMRIMVPGRPRPQGSRNWKFPVKNIALDDYRAKIAHEAAIAWDGGPTADPLMASVVFVFRRPKSHFGTGRNAEILKPAAPTEKTTAPDVDKLARSVLDSLTGVVYLDDKQVIRLDAWKRWGPLDETHITIARPRRRGSGACSEVTMAEPEQCITGAGWIRSNGRSRFVASVHTDDADTECPVCYGIHLKELGSYSEELDDIDGPRGTMGSMAATEIMVAWMEGLYA